MGGFFPKVLALSCRRRPILPAAALSGGGPARCFGGRSGGLRRKLRKKIPPFQQVGFGRLIEFQRRRHAKPRRIERFQNIRTHLVNDAQNRRFLVWWFNKGVQEFKSISYRRIPIEFAKAAAVELHDKLAAAKIFENSPVREAVNSGVSGVHHDFEDNAWVASSIEGGRRVFKMYSCEKLGFHRAFRAAVIWRKRRLLVQRRFVPHIFRKRQGSRRIM